MALRIVRNSKIYASLVSQAEMLPDKATSLIGNNGLLDRLERNTTSVGLTGFKLPPNRSMNAQRYIRQFTHLKGRELR